MYSGMLIAVVYCNQQSCRLVRKELTRIDMPWFSVLNAVSLPGIPSA